jgi:hypothetical protein
MVWAAVYAAYVHSLRMHGFARHVTREQIALGIAHEAALAVDRLRALVDLALRETDPRPDAGASSTWTFPGLEVSK